eukprot:gene3907-15225_t
MVCSQCGSKTIEENEAEVSEETNICDYYQKEASDISNLSLSLLDCSSMNKVRAERTSLGGERRIKDAFSKIANVISVALGDPSLEPSSDEWKSCKGLVCAIVPEPATRQIISSRVKNLVKDVYQSDDISHMCPGKKDCVAVRTNGDNDIDYKDLMSMCVCDVNNRDCMLHHCDMCPESSILKSFLKEKMITELFLDYFERSYAFFCLNGEEVENKFDLVA